MMNDKTVLITGGTGSFGKMFIKYLLRNLSPKKIIVFSRDELKQHEMHTHGYDDGRLRYFIGDVRDVGRLRRAMYRVDIVVHAAALKQVPACEYNPLEAIMTNIDGAKNVIEASLDCGVKKVIALSTDKAVSPVNLYGSTKLCSEKLFVQSNAYSGKSGTKFSCVRYGNVVGSRGSVIPVFMNQRDTGCLTVTDERMTRFWITLDQGVRFVSKCIKHMHGGEVFVPKIPSMKVVDLARAIAPECDLRNIGIRPGEKLHEVLVSESEAHHTLECDDMYVVKPLHSWWNTHNWETGKKLPEGYRYVSDTNEQWLSVEDLRAMINEYGNIA
jgi:UDP-N-acetylglucosamine 4,6-dehydratase/5-epimerase